MAIIKIPVYLVIDDKDDDMTDISDDLHIIDVNAIIEKTALDIHLEPMVDDR